ncbi:MAG: HPr-rel-A system PqqD family peptide chaperone, partial [Bacteroidota bacterium]
VRWHTVPSEELAWRELDGQLVVLNARSGSTHLLEPLAGEVLRALIDEEAGMTVPELVERLHGRAAAEDVAEWFSGVEAVLSEFQRLGLAEPEQP